MNIKNLKFRTRILMGFIALIILTCSIGIISIWQIKKLAYSTTEIYDHPFTVNSAVRSIDLHSSLMHHLTLKIVICNDQQQMDSMKDMFHEYEKKVDSSYDLVFQNFLGDTQVVEVAHKSYVTLKNELKEIINSKPKVENENELAELNNYIDRQQQLLLDNNKTVADFAQNKAYFFYTEALQSETNSTYIFICVIIILILISIGITFIVTKSISEPIYKFITEIRALYHVKSDNWSDIEKLNEQELIENTVAELKDAYKNLYDEIDERRAAEEKIEEQNQEIQQINDNLNKVNQELESKVIERTKKLAESESRFKRAIVYSPFPLMIHAEGEVIQLSDAWTEITGYDISEIPTTAAWTEKAYGAEAPTVQTMISENYNIQSHYHHGEKVITTKDGSTRIWDFSVSPIGNLADGRRAIITMAVDVTERNRLEELRHKSDELYRIMSENIGDGIYTTAKGVFVSANKALCEMFGYNENELIGKQAWALAKPENIEQIKQLFFEKVRNNDLAPIEIIAQKKDGTLFQIEIRMSIIYEGKLMGVVRDITERKRNEELLKMSEKRLSALIKINQLDSDNENEFLTVAMQEAIDITSSKYGYYYKYDEKTRDFTLLNWSVNVMPDCAIQEKQLFYHLDKTGIWGEAVRQRKPILVNNYSAPNPLKKGFPEGHVLFQNFFTLPVFNNSHEIVGVIGIADKDSDYTKADEMQISLLMEGLQHALERKKNEQTFIKLSTAVEQNPATIVITDIDGNIEYVNQKFCEVTGYTKEEAINNNPRVLKSGSQPDDYYKNLWDTIKSGKTWKGDFHNKKKNGALFWEAATISPIRDNQGMITHYLAIKEDITEKKLLEQKLENVLQNMESANWELKIVNDELKEEIEEKQRVEEELKFQKELLRQMNDSLESQVEEEVALNREKDQVMVAQSRQAAMGEMIGNIAHQWRQPLNAVNLMVFDLLEAYNYNELSKEYLEKQVFEIKSLVAHMSQTIDDFRNFFKPNKEKEDVSILNTIDKTFSFVEANLRNCGIDSDFDVPEDIVVKGYSNEISQVLLNVYNNSKDAVVERNILIPMIKTRLYKEGAYAIIGVSDNAGGISEEILHKVFDPYFTTKEQGKGTGIGLYMAKTIIEKNMGGKISVENIGDGAEFKIYLPI